MEKVFVFLDTNNWIYLSNGFDIRSKKHGDLHYKLFEFIEKAVDEGRLVVLVNSIIIEEFDRNKKYAEQRIADIEKKVAGHIGNIEALLKYLPEEETLIEKLQEALKAKADGQVQEEKNHIPKVEAFLKNKTKLIGISTENKVEATEMALAKKAPFVGDKKNSTADALHLLSMVEHMEKIEKKVWPFGEHGDLVIYPTSLFVSSNSGDFGDPSDSQKIHPDLAGILGRSETVYKNSLASLQDVLKVQLLTVEEIEYIEEADWIRCEMCENEFAHVEFDQAEDIFDPRIKFDSIDPNQLGLFGDAAGSQPFVKVRKGQCDYCGTDYLKCPDCEELIVVDDFNKIIQCQCSFQFIQHGERDRKGYVHEGELEIMVDHQCEQCGELVDDIDENGICSECVAYNRIAETGEIE